MSKQILPKVFTWMFIGLLVTFAVGYILATYYPYTVLNIVSGWGLLIVVIIEIALVIFLSARIMKMSPITARISFLLYSFVTGITFGTIFLAYELTSIIYVFLITAVVFAIFAFIGAVTKVDLSKLGTFLFMALIAVLICIVVNIFLQNSTFDLIISIVLILIFIGLTAYDVQQIIRLGKLNMINEDNLAIYGALDLYLDYINLFIQLLSIFGERK